MKLTAQLYNVDAFLECISVRWSTGNEVNQTVERLRGSIIRKINRDSVWFAVRRLESI